MARHLTRVVAVSIAVAVALTVACGSPSAPGGRAGSAHAVASSPAVAPPSTAPLTVRKSAWVDVSVATLWRTPRSPRKVDAPSLAQPARVREWLSGMTTEQRRGLNGRADTQALLGDRVVVLRLRPGWARVAVPDQPAPGSPRGYVGWVPRRQLTATTPQRPDQVATVVHRLAWLRTDDDAATPVLQVSFGTRLPVLETVGDDVRVATPTGGSVRVASRLVAVHDRGTAALPTTRAGVVASATMFTGLDYLWAGRSGFGFDCSGLTSLVYRVHGRTLPRDASPQSGAGTAVGSRTLRRGDLMFYATDGVVHHVSMYAGGGRMVHSPRTGSEVQVIATSTPAYAAEYVGARRFVG
ncbi:MAG: C40 family peptidase [Nocardioidaceae bacterium]